MANTETSITIKGRLSFPVLTHKEAVARNATSDYPKSDTSKVAPDFQVLIEQPMLDKLMEFIENTFLPFCVQQSNAGEKRNALTKAEADRILKVVKSDWTEQPPYIPLKPVHEKTAPMVPLAVASVKVIGQQGEDLPVMAKVNNDTELALPDPDLIKFPVVKPINQTVHSLYPGCDVGVTINLFSYISGKLPGFSAGCSTLVFLSDNDRFGGGVALDEDAIFSDD